MDGIAAHWFNSIDVASPCDTAAMWPFLQRDVRAVGRVLYPGAIPPALEGLTGFKEPITCTRTPCSQDLLWSIRADHPVWGMAEIECSRHPAPLPDLLIDHTLSLSPEDKALARTGQSVLTVRIHSQHKYVLRDRKRLLFWLKTLLQADGAVAVDDGSTLLWSHGMLEDEFIHDADLDIESLYTIHAVHSAGRGDKVDWLHTHGLGEFQAFDIDVLQPSPSFVENCGDPVRALAYAALEGAITADTDRFTLAYPGGDIRLVSAKRFHAEASPEFHALRGLDSAHTERRTVVCEPAGGLLARWRARPVPSRFLSRLSTDGMVVPFSTTVTTLMADRARRTFALFRDLKEEFASLNLPAVVKLGYPVDGGGPEDREHLWFEVHRIAGDKLEATLANTPHRVSGLKAGQRGEHGLDRLTDWVIMSPEGQMSPRNISAARRLRQTRSMWQARVDGAAATGA